MANRRQFIQRGIAISAASMVPMIAGAGLPTRPARTDNLVLAKIVFDRDFADCRLFAQQAARRGVSVHAISGDVTDLWYDDLYHRWKDPQVTIAGLTTVSSLFCLERLAWKCDRRVIFRTDHVRRPDGGVDHALYGPETLLKRANPARYGTFWPRHMAQLVTSCPVQGAAAVRARTVVASARGGVDDWVEPLASWIIALNPRLRS